MIDSWLPGKSFMNIDEYRDKVLGCWTGKNIGGTLGAPMEGRKETFDVKFYTQDLQGDPAPNDDLDLQLVWLSAMEAKGLFNVDERLLAECWMGHITGPWNEYGVAKFNIANGLMPPLSGLCNNERWKNSNGAWIRSEIWACMFPGEPDEVMSFAWMDSCVDHCGEGIYAEIFTAVLESAAFIEKDLRKLISYAFARIPENSRVSRSVKIVMDAYDKGEDWLTARNRVVADSEDLGWFQAPANVAYVILGLLYGEGDFGKSVCLAVNCGDDTDCTAATCGAILGIINGRSGIPKEWIEPIGEKIVTCSINPFRISPPATLGELTERVIRVKKMADMENPTIVRLTDDATVLDPEIVDRLADGAASMKRLLERSSSRLTIPLSYGVFAVDFAESPIMAPGETQELTVSFSESRHENCAFQVEWLLPEGWSIAEGNSQQLMGYYDGLRSLKIHLTAGEFDSTFVHIPVKFTVSNRMYPVFGVVTFERAGAVEANGISMTTAFSDKGRRNYARRKNIGSSFGIMP